MVKKVWRTDRQTDRQTDWTSHIAAWSQLKNDYGKWYSKQRAVTFHTFRVGFSPHRDRYKFAVFRRWPTSMNSPRSRWTKTHRTAWLPMRIFKHNHLYNHIQSRHIISHPSTQPPRLPGPGVGGYLANFSQPFIFTLFRIMDCLRIVYHKHIWQVWPQLNTCQIWTWFKSFKAHFCKRPITNRRIWRTEL